MMENLKNWIRERLHRADDSPSPSPPPQNLRKTGSFQGPRPTPPKKNVPRRSPEYVDVEPDLAGDVESLGPGKNVLIRNRFVREETGTHETLKILDDSVVDSGEETGIDPYNTGGFDRSKKWDQRFRK